MSTTAYLIENTGICPGHMAYFSSQAGRQAWFRAKAKYATTEMTIVRPDKTSKNGWNAGCIHVNASYDDTVACDYVMFQNTDLGNRWYYGMVTEREYVGGGTRVYFDLDYYSTYSDTISFGECLILRTHVPKSLDVVGKYCLPERISAEAIERPWAQWNNDFESLRGRMQPSVYIVYATTDSQGQSTTPAFVTGTPILMHVSVHGSIAALVTKLNEMLTTKRWGWIVGDPVDSSALENIVSIQYASPELANLGSTSIAEYSVSSTFPTMAQLNEYVTIHNAKTTQFPYMYMTARAVGDDPIVLKPQDYAPIEGGQATIEHNIQGCGGLGGGWRYFPKNTTWGVSNYHVLKHLDLPEYLQMPYSADAYAAWANTQGKQVGASANIGIANLVAGIGMLAATGGTGAFAMAGLGMAAGGLGNLAQAGGQMAGAYNMPDKLIGNSTGEKVSAFNLYGVSFYWHMPRLESIRAVDDDFSAHGYTVNTLDTPKLNTRSVVTYVQTADAVVKGGCPRVGLDQIAAMLNRGTSFWNCDSGEIGRDIGANV